MRRKQGLFYPEGDHKRRPIYHENGEPVYYYEGIKVNLSIEEKEIARAHDVACRPLGKMIRAHAKLLKLGKTQEAEKKHELLVAETTRMWRLLWELPDKVRFYLLLREASKKRKGEEHG